MSVESPSLFEAVQRFSTAQAAEEWLVSIRWPNGIHCHHCDSPDIFPRTNRKPQPFYCRSCHGYFSFKTGTVFQSSNIPLSQWAIAFYLFISSVQLGRDLGITQKSAWHMLQRIREAIRLKEEKLAGPVEVDEVYIGRREKNKHSDKKLRAGRGGVGKTPVLGIKDRATNNFVSIVAQDTNQKTLHKFILDHTQPKAIVCIAEFSGYQGLPRPQDVVKHSVREDVYTNGIESHWAVLRRGYYGIYHHMSVKHLQRYLWEFAGRQNFRDLGILDQMGIIILSAIGERLRYQDLTAAT